MQSYGTSNRSIWSKNVRDFVKKKLPRIRSRVSGHCSPARLPRLTGVHCSPEEEIVAGDLPELGEEEAGRRRGRGGGIRGRQGGGVGPEQRRRSASAGRRPPAGAARRQWRAAAPAIWHWDEGGSVRGSSGPRGRRGGPAPGLAGRRRRGSGHGRRPLGGGHVADGEAGQCPSAGQMSGAREDE